jgi:hypothetical protein
MSGEASHSIFQEPDWKHLRDYVHRYPQCRAELIALGDEMHAFDKAVWHNGRNPDVPPPERPNMVIRMADAIRNHDHTHQFSRDDMVNRVQADLDLMRARCGSDLRQRVEQFSREQPLDDIGPVEFSVDTRTASERLAAMPPEENPPHTMTLAEYAAHEGEPDPSRIKEGWRARVAHAIDRGLDVAPHIKAEYEAGIPAHLRPQPPKQYPDPKSHPPAYSVVPPDEKIESSDDDDGFYYHVIPQKHVKSVLKHGVHPNPPPQAMDEGWYRQYSRGKAFVSDRAGVPFWKNTIANHFESQGKSPKLAVVRIPKHHVGPLESDDAGMRDSRAGSYYSMTPILPKKPDTPEQQFARDLAEIGPVEFSTWDESGAIDKE